MKTKDKKSICEFRLKVKAYAGAYYIKRALKLEVALKMKPKVLRLKIIGDGEICPDTALLFRSILINRAVETQLITDARSSLQGGAVLLWLLGDRRTIREDARVFFKRNPLADEDPAEVYAGLGVTESKYKDSYSSVDPEDADYVRVLELINEFLPAYEFAGRIVTVSVLREFGLLENQRIDNVLAAVFSKSRRVEVPT